jgi:hypothetical protein
VSREQEPRKIAVAVGYTLEINFIDKRKTYSRYHQIKAAHSGYMCGVTSWNMTGQAAQVLSRRIPKKAAD